MRKPISLLLTILVCTLFRPLGAIVPIAAPMFQTCWAIASGITASGRIVVLNSACATPLNESGLAQIYLYDTKSGDLTMVNPNGNFPGGWNTDGALSASGDRVALTSRGDLIPGRNTDLTTEIFFAELRKGIVRQLTDTGIDGPIPPGANVHCCPDLDAAGNLVVFTSNFDQLSGTDLDHNEIYAVNSDGTGFRRLTSTTSGVNLAARIEATGRSIIFVSSADWTGGNPGHEYEIFRLDLSSGRFTQLTNLSAQYSGYHMFWLAADASGDQIFFDADLGTGGVNQIFEFSRKNGALRQLTTMAGGCTGPSASANGNILVVTCVDAPPWMHPYLVYLN